MHKLLSFYGFTTPSQKKALESLMRYANILKSNQRFEDYYPTKDNYNKILIDILNFVQLSQKYFVIREGTQERWEIPPKKWITENQHIIFSEMKKLGMVSKVEPMESNTDIICILGTTLELMQRRFQYTENLIKQEKLKGTHLILLTGARKAVVNIDGTQHKLFKIAKRNNILDIGNLTETHLLKDIYTHSLIYGQLECIVIDTPAGNIPRPTTETTILELVKWLNGKRDIKKIVFISNQPYIKYQGAIISQILKCLTPKLAFEIIGPKVIKNIPAIRLLEGLGSYIWAKTPEIIHDSGICIQDQQMLKNLRKLYSGHAIVNAEINSTANI